MFKTAIAFVSLFLLGSCASTLSVSSRARSELAPTGKLQNADAVKTARAGGPDRRRHVIDWSKSGRSVT
jgi:hypothetical protein